MSDGETGNIETAIGKISEQKTNAATGTREKRGAGKTPRNKDM